jgi:hypothetical protein
MPFKALLRGALVAGAVGCGSSSSSQPASACATACDASLSPCLSAQTCTLQCDQPNDLCQFVDCRPEFPKTPSLGQCLESCVARASHEQMQMVQCLTSGLGCTETVATCLN